MLLSFTVDGSPRRTTAGLLAAPMNYTRWCAANPSDEGIGDTFVPVPTHGTWTRHDGDSGPDTKVSWTMVGSLTHAV